MRWPASTRTTSAFLYLLHVKDHTHRLTPPNRYNQKWSRTMQNATGTALLCAWLGGLPTPDHPAALGRLLTLEDVGAIFNSKLTCPTPSSSFFLHPLSTHNNVL